MLPVAPGAVRGLLAETFPVSGAFVAAFAARAVAVSRGQAWADREMRRWISLGLPMPDEFPHPIERAMVQVQDLTEDTLLLMGLGAELYVAALEAWSSADTHDDPTESTTTPF